MSKKNNICFSVPRSGQEQKYLSLFLYRAQSFPSFLFYLQTWRYQYCWSKQDAERLSYEIRNALTIESLWLSGGAPERGIRRSGVRFLMGTQNFFFVLRSWQDETKLSLYFKIVNKTKGNLESPIWHVWNYWFAAYYLVCMWKDEKPSNQEIINIFLLILPKSIELLIQQPRFQVSCWGKHRKHGLI